MNAISQPSPDATPLPHLSPAQGRFVRLGVGGRWAKACIDTGTLRFGVPAEPHDACLRGDWDGAREQLLASGMAPKNAGNLLRELRDVYTLGEDCLSRSGVKAFQAWQQASTMAS